ncbi:hypothetical protein ES705_28912 [subsurface metagenome]
MIFLDCGAVDDSLYCGAAGQGFSPDSGRFLRFFGSFSLVFRTLFACFSGTFCLFLILLILLIL